jgi:hypothetical protein
MDGPSLGAGAETATGDITLDGIGAALEAGVQSLAKACQPEHPPIDLVLPRCFTYVYCGHFVHTALGLLAG